MLHHAEQSKIMNELASIFKTKTENVIDRVKSLIDERKLLQSEIINLRKAVAMGSNDDSQNILKIEILFNETYQQRVVETIVEEIVQQTVYEQILF